MCPSVPLPSLSKDDLPQYNIFRCDDLLSFAIPLTDALFHSLVKLQGLQGDERTMTLAGPCVGGSGGCLLTLLHVLLK